MTVYIGDFQVYKTLTGFNFNIPRIDLIQSRDNYGDIDKKVTACKMKVSDLTGLEISLKNYLTVVESEFRSQVISRFKGDIKLSIWIGADTVFNAFTQCDDNLAEADFLSAGLFKLSELYFQDTAEGENFNISQEYGKKNITLDLAAIKTAKGIVSSEVSIYYLITSSGTVNLINSKDVSKLQSIINFNISGFFFKSKSGLDESALITLGFLKEVSAETAGFLKDASAISAGFIKENKVYTGSDVNNLNFPIGTCVMVANNGMTHNKNQSNDIRLGSATEFYSSAGGGVALSGTWRARGWVSAGNPYLFQRTA